MTRRPWTDDDLAHLEALWRAGKLSIPQIAERMGRTRGSVQKATQNDRTRFPRRYVRDNTTRVSVTVEHGLKRRIDDTARAHGINRTLFLRTLIRAAMDNAWTRDRAVQIATHRKTVDL
jgi:hypothetical protein